MVRSLRKEALIVTVGSFAITVKLLLFFRRFLHFELKDDHGIVSWVTANAYPIRSQLYYYILSFAASIILLFFFYALWNVVSRVTAKIYRISLNEALRIDAMTYVFGILGLLVFFIDRELFLKTLPFFIFLIFFSKLLSVPFYRFLKRSDMVKNRPSFYYEFLRKLIKRNPRYEYRCPVFLRRLILFIIVPAIIYFLFSFQGVNRRIDFYHEGELLAPCQEMLNGAVPYRDFYIAHGILHDAWLPYLGLKLFGITLEGFRRFYDFGQHGLIAPLGYISIYLLCLFLFRRKITIVFAFLLLLHTTGMGAFSGRVAFGILALSFILSFIDIQKAWKLFGAGACIAIAIMYSAEIGTLSLISITLFLMFYFFLLHSRKDRNIPKYLFAYGAGFSAVFLPFVAYLFKTQSLAPYLQIMFVDSLKLHSIIFGLPFGEYSKEKYLPIIIYLVGSLWIMRDIVFKNFTNTSLKGALLLVSAAFYFFPALRRSDSVHFRYVSFLPYIILLIPAESFVLYVRDIIFRNKRRLWQRDFFNIALSALCIIVISEWILLKVPQRYLIDDIFKKMNLSERILKRSVGLDLERAGNVSIPPKQAKTVRTVVNFIQNGTGEDDYIYDFSNKGIYYFLANRRCPTRYLCVRFSNTPEQQREVVNDLITYEPKYVLFEDTERDDVEYKKRYPVIWSHIETNYEIVFTEKKFHILQYKKSLNRLKVGEADI